jgi:glycosyltransferase involved in cell wall biosynthesis
VHGYHGTCVSGTKTFKSPTIVPCSRRFGWPCLVNYYPRRCGGWSPTTMIREFRRQSLRLPLLSQYRVLVAFSDHMLDEYARHGIRVTCVSPPMESRTASLADLADRPKDDAWQLLFVGRMDQLKGGLYLLDALPRVAGGLARRLGVTLVGDGPARASWQSAAARLAAREARTHIEFTGWLDKEAVDARLAAADLLIVPSLWPEPFGLVGLEAARNRLPVAAFAVGGIPDWLRPGVNGYLAPGDPPTPDGLADAIIECLKDPETYGRLCEGAGRVASELSLDRHLDGLMRVLEDAVGPSAEDNGQR